MRTPQQIQKHAEQLKCKAPHHLVTSQLPHADSSVDETIHTLTVRVFRIFHLFRTV